MFDKKRQYSYKEQKLQQYKLLRYFIFFLVIYALYNFFSSFIFSVWVIDNSTMQPGLNSGDRVIFSSIARSSELIYKKIDKLAVKRGAIVLIDVNAGKQIKLPLVIIDGIVRFFTAQRISIFDGDRQYYVKRVVGLPGDDILMSGFVFKVKPAGSQYSLTEFELAEKPYNPVIPQTLWDDSVPFSGNMEMITLMSDEYFVVSDDRASTNDSRTWGPLPAACVTAHAVFRFWPLSRIGVP
jgi:signal peptidase I